MGQYFASVQNRLVLPARVLLTRGQEQQIQLSGRTVPASVPVRLIIDTGSGRSALLPSLITHLNPVSRGAVRVETSAGSAETAPYWVRLEFPGTALAPVPELAVARLALPPSLSAFHGLIGRDLLSRWEYFLYAGRRERFTIRDTPGGLLGWLLRLGIM